MLLQGISFALLGLLLTPATLATPVPGKEIGVRETSGEIGRRDLGEVFYKPPLDLYCRAKGWAEALDANCVNGEVFTVFCRHPDDHPPSVRETQFRVNGVCKRNYFCSALRTDTGHENQIADPPYRGKREIGCTRYAVKVSTKVKTRYSDSSTPLTDSTPTRLGTMIGTLVLTGNLDGFKPAMTWRYKTADTGGLQLIGDYLVPREPAKPSTHVYSISFNYVAIAQFVAAVYFLNPFHADVSLTAYVGYLPRPILGARLREDKELRFAELEDEE